VVEADEHEKGERRKLNFGHTFGHALEKLTGISHGKAIGVGMMMAAEASVKLGFLDAEDAEQLEKVIAGYQLPVQLKIDKTLLLQAMRKDKKREGEGVHLVLLKGLGNAFIHTVSYKQLEEIIYDMHCCQ
jgi:3-dehydroquinate synthase